MSHEKLLRLINDLDALIHIDASHEFTGSTYRVALTHLIAGARADTASTRISIARLAYSLRIDDSTVSRSYRQLEKAGVIRRHQPRWQHGLAPEVARTEWCLQFQGSSADEAPSPDRPFCTPVDDVAAVRTVPSQEEPPHSLNPEHQPQGESQADIDSPGQPEPSVAPQGVKIDFLSISKRLSAGENASLIAFISGRVAAMEFDPHSRLSSDEQSALTHNLQAKRMERLAPGQASSQKARTPASQASAAAPSQTSLYERVMAAGEFAIRLLRREFPAEAIRLCNEVAWSIAKGDLGKIAKPMNDLWGVGIQKIRQGVWTTPYGMHAASSPPSCKAA